jgi:hypothetical protein
MAQSATHRETRCNRRIIYRRRNGADAYAWDIGGDEAQLRAEAQRLQAAGYEVLRMGLPNAAVAGNPDADIMPGSEVDGL